MKNYLFYQLLDRELPRAIDGATKILTTTQQNPPIAFEGESCTRASGSQLSDEKERNPSLAEIYPMGSGRSSIVVKGNRIQKLRTVRNALSELSLAFAISKFGPFVDIAERLVSNEILGAELLLLDEWSEDFSLNESGESGWRTRLLIVEIVLGLEMLRGLGKIEKALLTRLHRALAKRLVTLDRKSVSGLAATEQFAWVLEQTVIALYLGEREVFEKIQFLVETKYAGMFSDLLATGSRFHREEILDGVDCFLALSYWLDEAGDQDGRFVKGASEQLRKWFPGTGMDQIQRGAWVVAGRQSLADTVLRDTSALLVLGNGLDRPEMIDCWIEGAEGSSGISEPVSTVISRPLLWFGSEEWEYRPFSRQTLNTRSVNNRY